MLYTERIYIFSLVIYKYGNIFPGSSDLFFIVSYYIKWVKTSGTYSTIDFFCNARGS